MSEKIAKVIATAFVGRSIREDTQLCGNPLGFFSGSQNFPTCESIIKLINFNIEMELKCDPGAKVDLIIVNGDTGWKLGREFLDTLDGKSINNGTIHVLHRPPIGLSYGSYDHAFKVFGNSYDYFIFTEDDHLIANNGYAKIALDLFKNTENCGFVAYQGLTSVGLDLESEDAFAAHGGYGLTSAVVLNDIIKNFGSLPHSKLPSSSLERYFQARDGEIAFTNKIHKIGYELIEIPKQIKLYDFAYDLMRGIDVKRFPSFLELLNHRVKQKIYKYKVGKSINKLLKKYIK